MSLVGSTSGILYENNSITGLIESIQLHMPPVVNKNTDSRIKLFSKQNGGVSSARNYGISKSIGEFIAFLDADDLWLPDHLESLKMLRQEKIK